EVRVRGCRDGSRTSQAGRWSTRRRGRIVDPNRPDFNRGRRLDASSRRRPVPTAFLAAAAPTKGYASPRGTLRPSRARYRPPAGGSLPPIVSPAATSAGPWASFGCLFGWRPDWAECAPPPFAAAIADVKKYLSSKIPRFVAMYLLAVTRETVDSCIEIASA